jgi:hypothetical protein
MVLSFGTLRCTEKNMLVNIVLLQKWLLRCMLRHPLPKLANIVTLKRLLGFLIAVPWAR